MTETTIIPRPDHPISRKSLSPNAIRVLYRLRQHGYIAHLVGGCVRDLWLGREPKDFDVATDATPGQVKRLFRNCRLVGRRFRLAHLHFTDEIIEVATFRASEEAAAEPEANAGESEGKVPPRHLKDEGGMVLRDNVFGTPAEDALRRDFTVNALSYDISDFSLIDYVGGVRDLENGVIRTIGDPLVRFTEDPVRMLRAVRFAALLGFTIEEQTWQALVASTHAIVRSSPPRLYEEMLKLLFSGAGEQCYQLLRKAGLLKHLLPAFGEWLEEESGGFPHVRVGKALDRIDSLVEHEAKPSIPLMLALVFGQYVEEKAARFRLTGAPAQQALDMGVAEFLGETAPRVLIPHRVAMLMREILLLQHRLRKVPGKKPDLLAGRHGFPDALFYLGFTSELTGRDGDIVRWWHSFLEERPSGVETEKEAEKGKGLPRQSRKRRRPRRRGKQRATPSPQGDSDKTQM